MNQETTIRLCFEEWRKLTEEEAQNITHANWTAVSTCQARKLELQRQILALEQHCVARGAGDGSPSEISHLLNCLVQMEVANAELLAAQKARFEIEHEQLNRACTSIRSVQRVYRSESPAVWQSYS